MFYRFNIALGSSEIKKKIASWREEPIWETSAKMKVQY